MTLKITLTTENIDQLDLSPVTTIIEDMLANGAIAQHAQQLQFSIKYDLDPTDPRELSEIPEIRLWFIRLDALYPWLPFILDWRGGELARYSAMLVPHQFHRTEGIRYNPEALEIWVMHKVFTLSNWLPQQGIPSQEPIGAMAQMFGYDLDNTFLEALAAIGK